MSYFKTTILVNLYVKLTSKIIIYAAYVKIVYNSGNFK